MVVVKLSYINSIASIVCKIFGKLLQLEVKTLCYHEDKEGISEGAQLVLKRLKSGSKIHSFEINFSIEDLADVW